MKSMNKCFVLLALILAPCLLNAQTVQKELPEVSLFSNPANTASWRGFNGISSKETHGDKSLNKVAVAIGKGVLVTLGGKGIIAVDENGTTKWTTGVKGLAMTIGKFKNYLIVFSTPHLKNATQAYTNELNASLIDPVSGKVVLQKNINTGDATFIEQALFFLSDDGSFCKVGLRLSNRKQAIDITLVNKFLQQFGETQSFTLIELDEKLERKNETKLTLPEGGFGGAQCNSKGEVFIRTIPSKNAIQVSQFVSGNTAAVKTLVQTINARDKDMTAKFLVSKNNPSVVYLATLYEDEDKEAALSLSRLNFADGTKIEKKEQITRSRVKDLEKNYKVVNEKMDKPDLGKPGDMRILELEECGDQLFTSIEAIEAAATSTRQWDNVYSVLLTSYDLSFNLKSQNIVPRFYMSAYGYGLGIHRDGNILRFIANDHPNMLSNKAMYGELDLKTGQVIKLNHIEKDRIEKGNPMNPANILWYPSGFVLTYINMKGMGGRIAHDIQVCKY